MHFIVVVLVCFVCLGAGAAVTAGTKNEDGSFKLTEESLGFLGVRFMKLGSSKAWEIPAAALVRIKFTTGVYRRYEGDITYIMVKAQKTAGSNYLISSGDLEAGDEVAVEGVNYLRMTESDLKSGTVDSCAH